MTSPSDLHFWKTFRNRLGSTHSRRSGFARNLDAFARAPVKTFDSSNVIKADQFPTWHSQFVEKTGFTDVLKMAVNIRALDTIKEWGEKLKRQHRPANQLDLPEFMQPRVPASDWGRKAEHVAPALAALETRPPRPAVAAQASVGSLTFQPAAANN